MKQSRIALALLALLTGVAGRAQAASPQPLDLGSACGYAILAGSAITNSDGAESTITGNVGLYPAGTASESGMTTDTDLVGTDYTSDPSIVETAQADLATAYGDANGLAATSIASELGATTEDAGVYNAGPADLTGTLVLDAQGNTAAVFIFQISALTTAANSAVTLVNGAQPQNVFFVDSSSATLGAPTAWAGTLIAQTSITVGIGSAVDGGVLAMNGAVTFNSNTISSVVACAGAGTPTPTPSPTGTVGGTGTASPSPTGTSGGTGTATPSPTGTSGGTGTATPSPTGTSGGTGTATPSPTGTSGGTGTATPTATSSPTTTPAPGPMPINLGAATGFSILAGSGGITNSVGPSSADGNVGTSGTEQYTGVLNEGCADDGNGPATSAALASLSTAYNNGQAAGPATLIPVDLAGQTLTQGVYAMATGTLSMSAGGTLILDAAGNTNAVFIFQAPTGAMNIGASDTILLENGARPQNVFWVVAGSATLGANDVFVGTLIAQVSVSVGADASIDGSVMALSTVTLDQDTITTPAKSPCAAPSATLTPTGTPSATPVESPTPTPTVSGTPTVSPVETATQSPTASGTATATPAETSTPTPTAAAGMDNPGSLLGTASGFSIMAVTGITVAGASTVSGYVGTYPDTSETGPLNEACTDYSSDAAVMQQAQAGLLAAYNNAWAQTPTETITPLDLGGRTLTPGVYFSGSTLGLTGTLTLDGDGNTSSIFIIQVTSSLTTATDSDVVLTNGAEPWNVYWVVGSSATLGTYSNFVGTLMAHTSIAVETGATVVGRLLALNGTVTLDANSVRTPSQVSPCSAMTGTFTVSNTFTATPDVTATPTNTPSGTGTTSATASPTASHTPSGSPTAGGGTATPSPTSSRTEVTAVSSATPTSTRTPTAVVPAATPTPVSTATPSAPRLTYFYPSPSRGNLGAVAYDMAGAGNVNLRIYNQDGTLVDTITDSKGPGWQTSEVTVAKFAPGVYYYVLQRQYFDGGTELDAPIGFVVLH